MLLCFSKKPAYSFENSLLLNIFGFEYVRTVLIKLTIMEIRVQTDRVKKILL